MQILHDKFISKIWWPWTETKLNILAAYIDAYTTALKNTPFELIYVDAFAGSGSRSQQSSSMVSLFELEGLEEVLRASPRIALEVSDKPFDRFLFVDKKLRNVRALEKLIAEEYPDRRAQVIVERGDANEVISEFCRQTNWRRTRAVLFLDPYGMQADWSTIEAIAATRAIDLWYLFPTGMGLNRLMTKSRNMEKSWEDRLDRNLGTTEWRDHFYNEVPQPDLFEADRNTLERVYDDNLAESFVLDRLRGIFAGGVASKAVRLRNTHGHTMFILTFACSNPRATPAIRIAEYLVQNWDESDRSHG